jgi:hypothetical protein
LPIGAGFSPSSRWNSKSLAAFAFAGSPAPNPFAAALAAPPRRIE